MLCYCSYSGLDINRARKEEVPIILLTQDGQERKMG
jgi:hypothetical protein